MVALLQVDAGRYAWVAATIDANSAAGYELSTAEAVMAIGGFNGTDPVPSLARFEKLVAEGKIHYFIGGGRGGNLASRAGSSEISDWVSRHFTAKTVGGTTVYDLTQPAN